MSNQAAGSSEQKVKMFLSNLLPRRAQTEAAIRVVIEIKKCLTTSRRNKKHSTESSQRSIPQHVDRRSSMEGCENIFSDAKIHNPGEIDISRHFANLLPQQKRNVWCFVKHNENIPLDAPSPLLSDQRCPRKEAQTMYGHNKHFTFRDISRKRSRFCCFCSPVRCIMIWI